MRSKSIKIYFFFCWKGSVYIVQKKELVEQIGKLNVKITTSNKELTGIWVSKYEVSTSDENCNNTNLSRCTSNELKVESKRGNNTWRNNYLSYFYQSIKKHGVITPIIVREIDSTHFEML